MARIGMIVIAIATRKLSKRKRRKIKTSTASI